jgi:hypothetical protein
VAAHRAGHPAAALAALAAVAVVAARRLFHRLPPAALVAAGAAMLQTKCPLSARAAAAAAALAAAPSLAAATGGLATGAPAAAVGTQASRWLVSDWYNAYTMHSHVSPSCGRRSGRLCMLPEVRCESLCTGLVRMAHWLMSHHRCIAQLCEVGMHWLPRVAAIAGWRLR